MIRIGVPPHDPRLVRKLKPAALHVLGLLGDGRPHTRVELERIGGNRYCSRVNELRRAWHHILGPRGWTSPVPGIGYVSELEPKQDDLECYRLVVPS